MRFYNPGSKIQDQLAYTHPTKDPKEGSTLSYHLLQAEEKDFFEVPSQLTLDTPEGEVTVSVNFPKRVKALYLDRGVVMIDDRLKDIPEDDNAASSDKEARIKGNAMWKEYLKSIVTAHYTAVAEIKQNGGVPRAAKGLTSYAIKALGMEDPADQVDTITRAKEGQVSNADTQKQITDLTALVNQLRGALESKSTV